MNVGAGAKILGAVTVGGLAVLYYAQQVGDLEQETASTVAALRHHTGQDDR